MSINASFLGKIGRNATVNQSPTGVFTNFSVAVNDPFSKDNTEWVDCSFYGERGTKLAQHLVTGTKVFVTGRLNLERFLRKSGEKGSKLKLRVVDLEFASSKPKEEIQSQIDSSSHTDFMDIPF